MAAKKKTAKKKASAKKNLTKAGHKKYKAPRQVFLTLSGDKDVSGTYGSYKEAKEGRYDNGVEPEQVVGPYILAERNRQE